MVSEKEIYEMFTEIKEEIHTASTTCLSTQAKCHEEIHQLNTKMQVHTHNPQIHCSEAKKKECNNNKTTSSSLRLLKSLYTSVVGLFLH